MAYVKFLRGSVSAYNNLPTKDENTLYFVYGENNETTALYLGSTLIAGTGITSLEELKNVVISTIADNDILLYREGKWINVPSSELGIDSISDLEDRVKELEDLADGLDTDLGTAETNIQNLQNSLANVYTKVETEAAIQSAITSQEHLKRKLIAKVSDIDVNAADALQYIYMVSTNSYITDNKYDEYLVLEVSGGRVVERVGSWEVNLDDYAKAADLTALTETVAGNKTAIEGALANEITRAKAAELANADAADEALKAAQEEATRAAAAEGALSQRIDELDFVTDEDLSNYVQTEDLDGYAKSEDLTQYVKTEVLDNYIQSEDLNNYVQNEALNDYVKNEDLINSLDAKADKATTLAGYGITDAYTKAEADKAIADKVANVTGGESAAAVKLLLEAEVTRSTEKDDAHDTAITLLQAKVGTLENDSKNYVTNTIYVAQVGNLADLIHASGKEDSTIVEEINYLNERLTWNEIN